MYENRLLFISVYVIQKFDMCSLAWYTIVWDLFWHMRNIILSIKTVF